MIDAPNSLESQFQAFFQSPVTNEAASALSNGSKILLEVNSGADVTQLTFTRDAGKNKVYATTDHSPKDSHEVSFHFTLLAAQSVLSSKANTVGSLGVEVLKLIASKDASSKIKIKVHAGYFSLFSKGYFGVMRKGGAEFAKFLASKGLGSIGAIKNAIKNMRSA